MTQPISQIIRDARKARGLTQEQLANLVHVSRQTVSHWENGRAEPGYDMLRTLADELGLDPAQLFGDGFAGQEASTEPQPTLAPQPAVDAAVVPPAHGDAKRSWRFALPSVCILLALVLITAFLTRNRSPYTLRDFTQEQTFAEHQTGVLIYTHDAPIARTGTVDSSKWEFPVFFKEQNGIGMEITALRLIWFREHGSPLVDELSPEAFSNNTGSTRIGPGEIRFINIGQLTEGGYTHFGCELVGVDDRGNEVVFRMSVPLI